MKRILPTIAVFAALAVASGAAAEPLGQLRFAGSIVIPNDLQIEGTLVGGLSGIDYDAANDLFIAISDDRSDFAPARFYTLQLDLRAARLSALSFERVTTLRQANGQPYPNGKAGGNVPDPESIRLDPADPKKLWWSSEGDRARGLAPSVVEIDRAGHQLFAMPMPAMFASHPSEEKGPRNNLAFEALSFSADGRSLWIGMESALYEDGPLATPDAGTMSRFSHMARDGKLLGQYAYPIDAIPGRPGPGRAADNGVSEILALDARRLLVIERAAIQDEAGAFRNDIRLYEADMAEASDVAAIPALAGAAYKPMTKRLIANLGQLMGARIDNVEGVSWGPTLPNGHRTLVFVSDNNFNKTQATQVIAFEVLP